MAEEQRMSQPESRAAPGSRIAGYEIVRLIGRGGMSEVYEAIQVGTGRRIALKLLGGRRADDPLYVERLQREGYALARIRHPNVVVVYDAGVSDGQAWIAMDLLEGQSLRELLIEKRRLPLPQALAYASAIFDGLEAAHRLHIVHRDVKPENVFLTYDGGLKIVDFGNAKLLNSGTKSTDPHKVFGTAAYMSPEQLGFRHSVGPRSDLYSVGLMLYEMLRGRHPFSEGPTAYDLPPSIELCRLQIEELPRPLHSVEPKIPEFVSEFVSRLVAKEPDQRPESAFKAAREVRDMHDLIVREAHNAGLAPATLELGPSRVTRDRSRSDVSVDVRVEPERSPPPAPSKRASFPPQSRRAASRFPLTTGMAIFVGAIVGAVLFAIISVSRQGTPRSAAASSAVPVVLLKEAAPTATTPTREPEPVATPPVAAVVQETAPRAPSTTPAPAAPAPKFPRPKPVPRTAKASPDPDPYAPIF